MTGATPLPHGRPVSWRVLRAGTASAESAMTAEQALAGDLRSDASPPVLLLWRCARALIVTRRDAHLPRFAEAVGLMRTAGWPVFVRRSGGGACPLGPGTLQVAAIEPARPGATIDAAYRAMVALLRSALGALGVAAREGEVDGAFCPGAHDLAVGGRKLAGMSQHWFSNAHRVRCVLTTASINVEEPPDLLAPAVNRFYASAGGSFRCRVDAVTSLRHGIGAALDPAGDLAAALMSHIEARTHLLAAAAP